jgi:hypothetical protein
MLSAVPCTSTKGPPFSSYYGRHMEIRSCFGLINYASKYGHTSDTLRGKEFVGQANNLLVIVVALDQCLVPRTIPSCTWLSFT